MKDLTTTFVAKLHKNLVYSFLKTPKLQKFGQELKKTLLSNFNIKPSTCNPIVFMCCDKIRTKNHLITINLKSFSKLYQP